MKKHIFRVIMILVLCNGFTVNACNIPIESAPICASGDGITITENLIGDILMEVQNGLGYGEANGKAQAIVCKAVIENQTDGFGYADLMSIARNSIFLYRDMYLRPELYEAKKEAVYWLICDLITDVGNGKNYKEALDEAYTRIYQSVDNAYTENAEYASDKIYWDVPPADFVMFTQARKFLLEAIPKTK